MPRIYVDKYGDTYQVLVTGSTDGSAEARTVREDEMDQHLRSVGCTDKGVSNLREQLKLSAHAEIDL